MIEIKTSTGFTCTADESAAQKWDFIEDLAEADKGNIVMFMKCIKKLIGDDQYNALKAHCAELDGGEVMTERMMQEFTEIFNNDDSLKNT